MYEETGEYYYNVKRDTMYLMDQTNGSEYEYVYQIRVVGTEKEPGEYRLQLPEGTEIESQTFMGEAWPYSSSETSFYSDLDGVSGSLNAKYMAKIVVKDTNSVRRTYVIAYAQDPRGLEITEIEDEANTYLYRTIQNRVTSIPCKEGEETEDVYLIQVVGKKAELGDGYVLELPEDSKVTRTTPDSPDWRYGDIPEYLSRITWASYDEDGGGMEYHTGYGAAYAARIEVTAPNDTKRVYVIAYAQDDRSVRITGISDDNNQYVFNGVESPIVETLSFKEPQGEDRSEEVYLLRLVGTNAELGTTYHLEYTEGSTIKITTPLDAAWNYYEGRSLCVDMEENGQYTYFDARYAARIELTGENGLKRIYVIAYMQDDRDVRITGISDENNSYILNEVCTDKTDMYLKEPVGEDEYETVHMIQVVGAKEELGKTFQLEHSDGNEVTITYPSDSNWNYSQIFSGYRSVYVDGQDAEFHMRNAARVEVTNGKGLTRVYVIAYAQDDRAAALNGIKDKDDQPFAFCKIEDAANEEDFLNKAGADSVYRIFLVGSDEELGGYDLELPEDVEIKETTLAGQEWPYKTEEIWETVQMDGTEYSIKMKSSARVVVQAYNGAKRIYLIIYAHDPRS